MANHALGLFRLPSPSSAHCFRRQIAVTVSLQETRSGITGSEIDYELESIWKGRETPSERRAAS